MDLPPDGRRWLARPKPGVHEDAGRVNDEHLAFRGALLVDIGAGIRVTEGAERLIDVEEPSAALSAVPGS
ncbi:MAG: hypothetical protein ACRDRK_12465 [Pseudonocardia sp.]